MPPHSYHINFVKFKVGVLHGLRPKIFLSRKIECKVEVRLLKKFLYKDEEVAARDMTKFRFPNFQDSLKRYDPLGDEFLFFPDFLAATLKQAEKEQKKKDLKKGRVVGAGKKHLKLSEHDQRVLAERQQTQKEHTDGSLLVHTSVSTDVVQPDDQTQGWVFDSDLKIEVASGLQSLFASEEEREALLDQFSVFLGPHMGPG